MGERRGVRDVDIGRLSFTLKAERESSNWETGGEICSQLKGGGGFQRCLYGGGKESREDLRFVIDLTGRDCTREGGEDSDFRGSRKEGK